MRAALLGSAVVLASLGASTLAHAQCAGRPTDAQGVQGYAYAPAIEKTFDAEHARVHYATTGTHAPDLATTRGDGVPDTVAFAATTAEDALKRFAERGFRAPPSDAACPSNGGDARIDVYLVRFAGADGTTVPEACTGSACASFVLVDSTFTGRGYATAAEGFATVVTHELFHAVQNAYDAQLDRFWAEGTAQWAMKALHPELQDFERQLPAFFVDPKRSIDTQPSGVTAGFLYGSAVFPLFLELAYGEGFVKATLEEEAKGSKAVSAIDAVLKSRGHSLAEAYPLFGAWNVATKDRAGNGGYPDAARYPGVKVEALEDGVSGITSGLGYAAYTGAVAAGSKVSLVTDDTRNAGVLVPLEGGKARLDKAAKLPTSFGGEALVVVAGITTKKTDAPYVVRITAADGASVSSSGTLPAGGSGDEGGGCAVAARTHDGTTTAVACVAALGVVGMRRRRRR